MLSLRGGSAAAALYILIATSGVFVVISTAPASYTTLQIFAQFWTVQLVLTVLTLICAIRIARLRALGFGPLQWRQLVWMLPAFVVVAMMLNSFIPKLLEGSLTPADRQLLWLLALTSLLVGLSEELMFRGILLRAALTRLHVIPAMLLSAVMFCLLHAVIGLGVGSWGDLGQQLSFTFLVGFFLAPLALKIGNLWPLIIWHFFWDLLIYGGGVLDLIYPLAFVVILFQVVLSFFLWMDAYRGQLIP